MLESPTKSLSHHISSIKFPTINDEIYANAPNTTQASVIMTYLMQIALKWNTTQKRRQGNHFSQNNNHLLGRVPFVCGFARLPSRFLKETLNSLLCLFHKQTTCAVPQKDIAAINKRPNTPRPHPGNMTILSRACWNIGNPGTWRHARRGQHINEEILTHRTLIQY